MTHSTEQRTYTNWNLLINNNDILRRLRYSFDFSDSKMIAIYSQADREISRSEVSGLLKKDEDPGQQLCDDETLAYFLNGLINELRGKKDGSAHEVETRLTNNTIFKKLKIALNLQSEDILRIMEAVDFSMSKHELSAFFRKKGHKHYKKCHDQILRNFLHGIQLEYRPEG